MKVALITNMPAPYRVPGFNILHQHWQNDFKVFFCTHMEANRKWDIPPMKFSHVFLKEKSRVKKDGSTFVHNNKEIFNQLRAYDPDIVITGGFNPTMIYAFLYSLLYRKKHIPLSDAWSLPEQHLSSLHRIVRRIFFRFSSAFLACSEKGKEYYKTYALESNRIFISHYTINNELFANHKGFQARKYDLLFAGQFTERKNPLFFVRVARLLKQHKKELKVLLLGDGPLREMILEKLREDDIAFEYAGYSTQENLPGYYANSRLFLFPTSSDAWGVVANESLASGTPVLTTPFAGCSDELVMDNRNGFVLPLEEYQWVEKCRTLLEDENKWASFSRSAQEKASQFTHEAAALAIKKACEQAFRD